MSALGLVLCQIMYVAQSAQAQEADCFHPRNNETNNEKLSYRSLCLQQNVFMMLL